MSLKRIPTLIAIVSLAALAACQDKAEPVAATPMPIIQNNQLRYPAGHPQLPLLVSTPAAAAKTISIELPARLVWNEEKTQRIYPAFAGRVGRIAADVGQRVRAGQVLAELASPEFGAAQADTTRTQADARLAQQNLQRQRELFEAGVLARKDLEQAEAEAARLDHACDFWMGSGDKPAAIRFERHAVVADQASEIALLARQREQFERERAFADAGGAAQQQAGFADDQSVGVDEYVRGWRRVHRVAGSQTTKRAPRVTSPGCGSSVPRGRARVRFRARMRPPCASIIWREMARPRPEFWPKPCSGRSV